MDGRPVLGFAFTLAGCVSVYLAAPKQGWLPRPWPARPARAAGALLLACGLACLCHAMQDVAAVFLFSTTVMMLLVLLPYLGALAAILRIR